MISVHNIVHPQEGHGVNPSQGSSDLQLITLGTARLSNAPALWRRNLKRYG